MKTVFVGLSGGVDSAVSAYLMKKEGYRVVGAFVKAWEPEFLPCTGVRDRLEAMRVAAHLGIPFVTYDLGEEYKREVVDPFIREYKAGRTPNPDVLCNRAIKFGAFWEHVRADGADFIATGHYALLRQGSAGQALFRGLDGSKDQSYFLWTLTKDDLAHALFPVGGILKSEVRKIAQGAELPNALRRDSQGLCFLGHVDMRDFLKRYLPIEKGPIYDTAGKKLGEHEGAWFYTIGEHMNIGGAGARKYIVSKDVVKNELVVSENPARDGPRLSCEISSANWIREAPDARKTYGVETRYHGGMHLASLKVEAGSWKVDFEKPALAVPGQSLVVYDPETGEVLGGGIIE